MPSIDQIAAASATTPPASTTTQNSTLDRDAFMKLMVAQMRYQDPSNPMDASQFLAQTAQFTNIELLQKLQESQTQLLSFQSVVLSSSLVGKTVTGTTAEGVALSGTVESAQVVAGSGFVTVGGTKIPVTNVTEVR